MKKLIAIALTLGLCGAAAIYMSSCAQLSGPLSPKMDLLTAISQAADQGMPTIIAPVAPGGVSDTAKVPFVESQSTGTRMAMDANTLNNSTVLVYLMGTAGTTETLVAYSVSYNAVSKQLTITPTGGAWTDNSRYHVIITIGAQNLSGNQLDGNGNRIPESAEFDNYHFTFNIGNPAGEGIPAYTNPNNAIQAVARIFANGSVGGTALPWGGEVGNVPAGAPHKVTIVVTFTLANGSVDPNMAFPTWAALSPYVSLTANGVAVAKTVELTSTAKNNDTLRLFVTTPIPGQTYKLRITGSGVGGLVTGGTPGMPLVLHSGFHFDGDADGNAEASDDTLDATFRNAQADNTANPTMSVTAITTDGTGSGGGNRRIKVQFAITTGYGTGTLNPATITNANFLLINQEPSVDEAFLPTLLELDQGTPGAPVVWVYVPLAFDANYTNGSLSVRVAVSNVTTAEGLAQDQDGDGIAGETNGDDVTTTDVPIYHFGE
jgi:Big-like domain-containing protein